MAEVATRTVQRTTSSECLEVLDEANEVLQDFKSFMEKTYPLASSLHEGAKWLWQDVYDLFAKKQDVKEVTALFEKQKESWNKLEKGATEIKESIKEKYANVESALGRVKKARGHGASRAFLGFPTPDQKHTRYVYHKKLQYAFHDAKDEVAMMCNFPDGMLVQIRLLREYAEKMATVPRGEYVPPKPKAPHLELVDEAEQVLQDFKNFMKESYTKASSLYERAKWLWQDVHDLRVKKAPDLEIAIILEHQAPTWKRLADDSATLRQSVDKEFAKVESIEDRVKNARGVYPNVAAFGFPTPEQRLARHLFARKYKYAFHDAKDEYAAMCGYPEGLLNKIHQVQELTLVSAGPAGAGDVLEAPKSSE